MRVLTVVGARPQFVKMVAVSTALRARHEELVVHTGQHYDDGMSELFFRELSIARPDFNLGVGSGTHGAQTAAALAGVERVILKVKPDLVLVYGDTNSTLAGALAAAKLHVPVGHVEAGLRSGNRKMPEELNRIVADHLADLLFAPTARAVANLAAEGIERGVSWVGDVMYDTALHFLPLARERFGPLAARLGIAEKSYHLATVHRAENTDDPQRLGAILGALQRTGTKVVFPVHPRTAKMLSQYGLPEKRSVEPQLLMIEPVGYLDMLALEAGASCLLTDSGGVQKEGYFVGTPVITLRDETEWVETVDAGWNRLVGADEGRILAALATPVQGTPIADYGRGDAAIAIVKLIEQAT